MASQDLVLTEKYTLTTNSDYSYSMLDGSRTVYVRFEYEGDSREVEGAYSMGYSSPDKVVLSLEPDMPDTYAVFEKTGAVYLGINGKAESLEGYKATITLTKVETSEDFDKAVVAVINKYQ